MNKESEKLLGLFARYFSILLIGASNLYVIYKILTPLTIRTLNTILSIFMNTILEGSKIYLHKLGVAIDIVPACVAGAAFYLLLMLVMSTADIKPSTRIKVIMTALATLFALNILRILLLIPVINTTYFETLHWIFWHFISTVFVVGIWVGMVKLYKIKAIPIYSDLKYISSLMRPKKLKKTKREKKSVKSKKSKRKKKNK